MGLIMTAAQKKKEASKARKIAKALFAKARDHARQAATLDKQSSALARKEKSRKPSKTSTKARRVSEPVAKGKRCSVWLGSGKWILQSDARTLEAARAIVRRIRSQHKGQKLSLVVRPLDGGPPPWPAPPTPRK